jgi:hypothetical protein
MQNFKNGDYQRLFFLFRDEAATLSMHESFPGEYMEPLESPNSKKLTLLKERIKGSGFDYKTYSAAWDEASESLTGLHDFGELVYNFIHTFIEETFGPDTFDSVSPMDEDDAVTDLFISQKNRFFIEEGLEDSLRRLESLSLQEKRDNVIMVTGPCGIGKSAFLSKFIQQAAADNKICVIPHFIGVTAHSAELGGTLRRLCHLLAAHSSLQESIPYELDKLILYFQRLIASLNPGKNYVLIIDALDQLIPSNSAHELRWLPQALPSNVSLIVSTNSQTMSETIREHW